MSTPKKEKPIKQFRVGYISAAVWERENNGKTFYNVSIGRSFKARNGQWKRTSTFDVADLPVAQALTEEAFRYCLRLQDAGAEEAEVEEEADEADEA